MKATCFLFPLYVVAAALAPLSVLAQGFYQGPYDPSAPVITGQPISPSPIPPPPSGDVYATPFNPGMQPGVPSMGPGPGMGGGGEDAAGGLPGVYGFVEVFEWDAHYPATPFTNTFTPPVVGTPGSLRNFSADYSSDTGYRVGVGWRFLSGWDVGVIYADFNTTGATSVGSRTDLTNPLAGAFDPLIPASLATAALASQRLSLDHQVFDLEMGRKYCICRTLILRPFASIRFAQFDHASSTNYVNAADPNATPANFADDLITSETIVKRTDIDGIGPRVGTRLSWNVGASGFQVFARSSISLLFSDVKVFRSDTQVADVDGNFGGPATLSATTVEDFDQIIPVIDIATGLRFERRGFFVSGGYELQNWFNVVTDPIAFSPIVNRGDIGMGGWFLRAGYNF